MGLMPNTKFQQFRMFVLNDLVERKIKSCRKSSKRFLEFKTKLGLDPEVVPCDEQDIIKNLHDKFEGETIITQYSIKNKRLDAYMPEYKIGIEIDEHKHEYRNEESRTKVTENHEITLIRTIPDDPNFDIENLIRIFIKEAIKKQTKKSLIDYLSKRLLELEFKSNYSIKSKCLKWVAKNILPKYKRIKNTQSKIKSIKIRKQPGTTYYFGCKDYMQNSRPEKVKMTNKVIREKSHCIVCQSNKGF